MASERTVLKALYELFPVGKNETDVPYMSWPAPGRATAVDCSLERYANPPLLPFDVFAIASHLLELSGAYHHIVPKLDGPDGSGTVSFLSLDHRKGAKRRLEISPRSINTCRAIAAIWREDITGSKTEEIETNLHNRIVKLRGLTRRWTLLFGKFGNAPIFAKTDEQESPPKWWALAHQLLMIADEAAVGVGFESLDEVKMLWFERHAQSLIFDKLSFDDVEIDDDYFEASQYYRTSLSVADHNIVCVQPKGRTTPVGCTMRSLSHHLALLPPQGVARADWYPPQPDAILTDEEELNMLLIPLPFWIPDGAFKGVSTKSTPTHNWGFFHVEQTWLARGCDPIGHTALLASLTNFILDLTLKAKKSHHARDIDAIVLPELALDFKTYNSLVPVLKQNLTKLEFFIAGLSDDVGGRKGNFVAVTTFKKTLDPQEVYWNTSVREKHHRWKLNRSQLESYGLTGALNPKYEWWEDLDLLSRRVDFTAFRKRSVLAAMICEDLARVDPCQELLRSIGPNLIIALLMDAPQLPTRWPARYATILAEDPGSSVLTLTSKALMNRQHIVGSPLSASAKDRVIALWRDDHHGAPIQIACPDHCQGVWLKLWSARVTDGALDGHEDIHGKTWIYGKHEALEIEKAVAKYPEILTVPSRI